MTSERLHVIVQAGGKGTRLKHLTANKPKGLVSVYGKPIIYHLFDRFADATFSIIGDYKFEVIEAYLESNKPSVDVCLVKAEGHGTASGISSALEKIPSGSPVLITWSDLIIHEMEIPSTTTQPVIYTTNAFDCRWSVDLAGRLVEETNSTNGVPGIFFFPDHTILSQIPTHGEFVRWLSQNIDQFKTVSCDRLEDMGELDAVEQANNKLGICRFFNEVNIKEKIVEKKVIVPAYDDVHQNEVQWYIDANKLGFRNVPAIHSYKPLVMERVRGRHPFEIKDISKSDAENILFKIIETLRNLHSLKVQDSDISEIESTYISKTLSRVLSVKRLIPNFSSPEIIVNGIICRNPFSEKHAELIEAALPKLLTPDFNPIHGDPTFSNTLVTRTNDIVFIDPRGSFAKQGIFGDAWYDFAKVYYSAATGYDAFNRKRFSLKVGANQFDVEIEQNPFSEIAGSSFANEFGGELPRIEIITGLIWLGLTGYAKDDVDSIIGSFALGLHWLESGLRRI